MLKAVLPCAVAILLGACAPGPGPEPLPPTVPGIDPSTAQPVDLTPGLSDLEPDVCKSAAYSYLVGQPAAAVATAGIAAPVRVIPPGGLVTEDYSSVRINFALDGAGNVAKITCG